MSRVTNVMVHCGILENRHETIEALNTKLAAAEITPLADMSCDEAGDIWGGNKSPETILYCGAYNYLDEDAFLEAVRSVKWADPENLQVFIQRQDEDRLTEVQRGTQAPVRPLLTVNLTTDGELMVEGDTSKAVALLASCNGKTPCPAIPEGMAICETALLQGIPTTKGDTYAARVVDHVARASMLLLMRAIDPDGLHATIERRLRSAAARNN